VILASRKELFGLNRQRASANGPEGSQLTSVVEVVLFTLAVNWEEKTHSNAKGLFCLGIERQPSLRTVSSGGLELSEGISGVDLCERTSLQ